MTTMIEKLARAISRENGDEYPLEHYIPDARACLTALLEPTEGMVGAGGVAIATEFTDPWDVLGPDEEEAMGLEVDGDDAYEPAHKRVEHFGVEAWKAMIRAALEEKA